MAWEKNSPVFIKSLKRDGVVVGSRRPGFYDVVVGSMTLQVAEADLTKGEKKPSREPMKKHPNKGPRNSSGGSGRTFSVDLHGMTVAEALEVVERRLDEALSADADRLDVVHGVGSGKLKSAVHRYLATLSVVKRYKLADGNPGTTWVFF